MTDDDRPRLGQLNLVARDVEATVAFYERLGVTFQPIPAPWMAHHRNAEENDGPHLDIDSEWSARTWHEGWPAGESGAVISFTVPTRDGVDRLHADLVASGYPSLQAPYDAFFGARFAVVADPDGNHVGLMSPLDDGRRAAPPTPPA